MKFLKKISGLLFLILIVGLVIYLLKLVIDKHKAATENISKIDKVDLIKIIDGDTILVKLNDKEESVRLIGIDAPEKDECFSDEAREKIKELIGNEEIKLETDESQNDRDKYDRLLRYVYLDDGTLINKKLIEEGVAKEYTYKIPYKFQMEFKNDQKMAEENKLGLWGGCKN